jgi:ketosteroid isomerase-like protein
MQVRATVRAVTPAVLLFASCTPVVKEGPAPSVVNVRTTQTDANKVVVRRAFTAREQGDVATLNELSDPDEMLHAPDGTTVRRGGPYTELKELCPMCAALQHRKITIDMMFAEGDLVYVRSTWSGSYTGTFKGVAVSGRDVTVVYSNVYRVVDGRVRDNWFVSDRLSLAEQLGMKLIPTEAAR